MINTEQRNAIKEVLELCEAVPYNTARVHETSTINAKGEHITHIDREQWLENIIEIIGDILGQEFDILTDSTIQAIKLHEDRVSLLKEDGKD